MAQKFILAATAALIAAGGATPATAQPFTPTKQIEVVVHSGPGAGNDVFGRAVISAIEQEKLVPVRMQIANRVGGGGTTAVNYMMSKAGDPHVLAVFTSLWISNPLVEKRAEHRMVDMTPISRLIIEPGVIVVRAESPFKSLKDFIEGARKNPGGLKQSGGSILGARQSGAPDAAGGDRRALGVRFVPGRRRAHRGAARRPCRHDGDGAERGRRADPQRQGARAGAGHQQARRRLREGADAEGGGLRRAGGAAGARARSRRPRSRPPPSPTTRVCSPSSRRRRPGRRS